MGGGKRYLGHMCTILTYRRVLLFGLVLGCIFLCDRNLFLGPQKPFLPGFLRIPEDFFFFRRNFSQEPPFGGGCRNSCFLPISQDFFAGIPAGQEFLYLLRIPQESGGFRRIPVPAKSCWLWPATKEGSLLSKIWTKIDLFNLSLLNRT
jgi:hypothetical protein